MSKLKVGDQVVILGTSSPKFYGNPEWGTVFEIDSLFYWVGIFGSEENDAFFAEELALKEIYDSPLYKALKEE